MWCSVGADGWIVAVLIGFGVDVVSCGRRCPVVGSSEMSSALCSSVVPVQSAVLLSESGCRVSAVRFCLEWFNGVAGGVSNVVVSAGVLSAELRWLESFPRVMVLGGVANVGCVRLPGAGCSVWVCAVRL